MKRPYTHGELYRTDDEDELWMLGVEPRAVVTGLEDTDPAIETLPPRRMPRATEGR